MLVHAANLQFDRTNDVSIAKTLFNFFLGQLESIVVSQSIHAADLRAMESANRAYMEDPGIIGIGGRLPNSQETINAKKKQLDDIEKNRQDALAIIEFFRDKFIAGELAAENKKQESKNNS